VLYLTPPMALVIGFYLENTMLLALGFVAWVIMAWTFLPTLSLYGLNSIWAPILPLAGLLYLLMTLDSARVYYAGQGGAWKGRTYGP
jgi:hypothetical protein